MSITIENDSINLREKIRDKGLETATTPELVALILKTGAKDMNVIELSKKICRQYSSLTEMSFSSIQDLIKFKHIGLAKACQIAASFELARRLENKPQPLPLSTPQKAISELSFMKNLEKEHLVGLYLNARNQLVSKKTLAIGDLNHASINPREIYAQALKLPCLGIILAHNHPSGESTPSPEDIEFTKIVAEGCKLLGLFLIDHIIITKESWLSMSQKELI